MNRLLSLLITILTIPVFGQQNKAYFRHLTSDDGLPSNYIEAIIQDHEGFMWFGTAEGLSRYDGYTFLNLSNSASDSTSLINNEVKCLLEDKDHNLWVGTQKGLTCLDLTTYKFKRFSNRFPESIGTNWISTLCLLDNENLIIGTFFKGVYHFNIKTEKLKHYLNNPADHKSLINNSIRSICKDQEGNIWLATESGLERFNPKTEVFNHLFAGEAVYHVALNRDGKVLASKLCCSELYTINPKSLQIEHIEKLQANSKNKVKRVFFDSMGNKWLSITDVGMIIQMVKDNINITCVYDKYNPDGINSNNALTMYEDRDKNIWIGTFDGGVNLFEKNRKPFIQVKCNYLEEGLQSNHVRSIYQDMEGEIWIGTKVGGMLSKFKRSSLTFIHYKQDTSKPYSFNDEFVFSITDAKPGFLWVGTLSGGLNLFEKRTGKFSAMVHNPGEVNGLASNSVLTVFSDKHDRVLIGHGETGLDIYNLKTQKVTHFSNDSDPNSLSNNRVRVIFKDSHNIIWIGTMLGLNLFDEKNNRFIRYINKLDDPSSISDNNIFCICEDKAGNLWIGTGNGINLYNRKKNNFIIFNKKNGFPAKSARGILDDSEGNLWISTDNGIVKFDPKDRSFKHYTKKDGLNSNEFAAYSFFKMRNGEMFFGSDNGFVLFKPEDITDNKDIPHVVITGFKLFNKEITFNEPNSPLKKHITNTKEITLNHKQSVFTLEFSALNYTSTEKNQYAFKMEGFDENWNYVETQRSATYTNLPAGKYIFRVKASNNDNIWNEQGTSVKITILPPPWKTWWAYLVYFLLTAFILYRLRSFTIKRIHEEKAHEMDQMKLQLFMNVSHEFRTPLTLMLNPLERISDSGNLDEIHSSVKVVKRSVWKLMNLVNQLLDFRKIELGKSPLRARPLDIVENTRKIVLLFEDLASSKGWDLKIETSLDELEVWLDPDKYEKIISNLLSNAFKFTDPGGRITISIETRSVKQSNNAKSNEYVEIRVKDTGIGLTPEELKNIFDRFYQVDQSKAGTGIGLNYVKNLVELHGGEVLVESVYEHGSTFIIRIPLGNQHLEPEQMVTFSTAEHGSNLSDIAAIEALQYDVENMDFYPEFEGDEESLTHIENRTNQVILIVEDNKTLRKQIRDQLKDSYQIREASNGIEGLEKVQKYLPDLIISDIMMPKMDGIELCKCLKTDLNTSHIPVILLTARNSTENKIEGFETGADEYITKPFSMPLLEVRIKNLIQNRLKLKERFSVSKALEPAKEYTTNNLDETFLEKATQLVIENIENTDFSITELHIKLGMSRTNLFNKLQSITGQNPSNFIRTIRLKYAAQLLLKENSSVKDICYKCGFNSPAYFIKTFRELYGQTPKEYLETHVKGNNSDNHT